MSLELIMLYMAVGVFVGLMAGMLGIGGGRILVPVLTTIFLYQNVPSEYVLHLALGTSMACIAVTSFSSLNAHHQRGAVIWSWAKMMAPGMVLGTFASTFIVTQINSKAIAIFFA